MASADRTTSDAVALEEALRAAPYRFGFFQALRRLECAYANRPRIGQAPRPTDDPVRLTQTPSLIFAPATLAAFGRRGARGRPHLAVYFFGLFGPNGALPLHLTEYARERLRNVGDATLVHFADVFHHRMLTLFYRAWASAQPTVSLDRPETDRFATYVGALFGLGMDALRQRDAIPDLAKLYYAGRLVGQTRHAEGLTALIADFFRVPVVLEEFVGHWLELPEASRWRLGATRVTGVLGMSAIVGARVWDRQYKFRVVLGPLGMDEYRRLLPGGISLRRLVALVRNYLGDELDWDVKLVLKKEEVPPLALGVQGQLGWTTWLASPARTEDAADLCLDARAHAA